MKRIWITGASSGIGLELARLLLEQGHGVAVSARTVEPLNLLQQEYPNQVLIVAGDLAEADEVQRMGERIRALWGQLDQVILNAGTCEYIDVKQFEAAMVERVMRANLLSAAHCIEVALPLLRNAQRGHIVAISSSVTYLPLPRAGAYGASKAAMRYLFNSLRIDLASAGIDVTLVSPGFVDTPLTRKNDFPMPMRWPVEKAARHIVKRLPKRPLEIAFPTPFIAALRLLALLPQRLQLHLGKQLSRPSTDKQS
ncbi:SDR family NAD(P)-dependent oxidoreductase [Ectopseudomonas mendocina]|uniref:SDR family NAD(P)-dependent oxidoreductase n=1 Tax=Ectopseudomonas mendocina TaxID=300 RepID=A0ABZ2RBH0_ECTME